MNARQKTRPPRTKILIVDDHPMLREGLAQLIGNQTDMAVCGEAGDAAEALEKIRLLNPNLVLADITLPGRNGLELIKDIQALETGAAVLVISMHDEALYAERVLRAGGRGSRAGELIARCMVETGTSSYYTALGEATGEPVLKEICRLIAADELRHFKLFYDHMRRWLARERIGLLRRLRIAAGRIGESEDDELAYAWHCANEPAGLPYARPRCAAAYMGRAMSFYRFHHIERSMGMVFKAVGLPPRGWLSGASARLAWRLVRHRQRRFARQTS